MSFSKRLDIAFLHNDSLLTHSDAQAQYSEIKLPMYADTVWKIGEETIEIDWKTDIDTEGKALLKLNRGNLRSERSPAATMSWKEFKEYASNLPNNQYIFRGQEKRDWRLRTSFHRAGRYDIFRFSNHDIPLLYKSLIHLTDHVFDLDKPIELGAFVSLVQHHGYPTPLLDWTYSPFIAAYFAYNDLSVGQASSEDFVRVHVFNKTDWVKDFPQYQSLRIFHPHFSILETLALNNPRMIPQQALASVTNVADIETYISHCEKLRNRTYLEVVDMPASDRNNVLSELRLMGITAGSLFPGLDGACRQIRAQMFDEL